MHKPKISTLLIAAIALPLSAREITPQEAIARMGADSPAHVAGKVATAPLSPVYTALTEKGAPAVYIFNNGSDGYFLLSADDAAVPVLGYADRGVFSADEMPPQMRWWMGEYARQIEYAREKGIHPYSPAAKPVSRSGEREAIAPMLKTRWDQTAPYNDQCPLSGADRSWTGCVATAMAQVMKYWNYPEKGQGSITYTIESLGKKVSMNFAQKKFDWDNMIDIYLNGRYTDEEAAAVAYLMKACGYAVKMQYSMEASGSLGLNTANAMVKYFDYDPNTFYTLREYYSSAQWDDMMYDNLKNVGPVVYGGNSAIGGGHCFVCDGYDTDGYYHFNWGWSGMSDGYFKLDALNPDALGTGGGGGGGYNFIQDAVFGIQPPTGKPAEDRPLYLTQRGELAGTVADGALSFRLTGTGDGMWINYNPSTMRLKFGAMFYPQGVEQVAPVYYDISESRFDLQPGYGVDAGVLKPSVSLSDLNLADGTYKVVVGSVPVPKNATSAPTDSTGFVATRPRYGCPNFFTLKVEDGNYTVSNDLLAPLVVSGEIIGDLYYGALAKVRVTVENPADVEQTSGFAPVFIFGSPVLMGQSVCLTIPPHSTLTREWETPLEQYVQYIDPYLEQELTFTFFNEMDYSFYIDSFSSEVVLHDNPGFPSLRLTSPMEIAGSFKDGAMTVIPDCAHFNVSGQLSITKGYFNYPLMVCLCEEVQGDEVAIVTTGSQNFYLSATDPDAKTGVFDIAMSYPLADIDKQYYIVLAFESVGYLYQIANIPVRFADPASVASVETDGKTAITFDRTTGIATITSASPITGIEVYDITGRKVGASATVNDGTAMVGIQEKGMHIISVTVADGRNETFKIIK